MTRNPLPAALTTAVFAAALAAATPAAAVSIKHTNRAEGEPDTGAPRSASRAAPPADTSGPHYFDKVHEDANRG